MPYRRWRATLKRTDSSSPFLDEGADGDDGGLFRVRLCDRSSRRRMVRAFSILSVLASLNLQNLAKFGPLNRPV